MALRLRKYLPLLYHFKLMLLTFKGCGMGTLFFYPAGDSGRVLFLTRFFFLSFFLYPAGAAAGSCFLLVSFLSCRRSRRILFPTRFFFLLLLSSSSFFFFFLLLLSSGNTSFSHISLHPILTKLGHNDRYLDHYSGTKDGGVRGHHGVTGVKKVICTKKASSPSDYVALTRDLCICSSLTPSTKVMVLKNCQGSFGVTGVKSSFSQKRHQVLHIM